MERCAWCCDGGFLQAYHDEEWGTPLHDDQRHFEYLLMEVMQCGLNWTMMLKKRKIFRACFDEFDYEKIANYGEKEIERILSFEGMIRSRRKVEAIIHNAKGFLKIREEYGSFDAYLWSFTKGKTYIYKKHQQGQFEAKNELSDRVSASLKKRGFKYLGSITVFSHLQACGMMNDHETSCYRYKQLLQSVNAQFIED